MAYEFGTCSLRLVGFLAKGWVEMGLVGVGQRGFGVGRVKLRGRMGAASDPSWRGY